MLIYQWIQKVRVVFHGCVTLCVCILNFTCHLLPCHVKSVIKWYSQANWTASCYQNRLSHSASPLCFHLIPRCTILVYFCHWCHLSVSQFNSLIQDKSWGFFLKVFWYSWLPVKDLSVQMNSVLSANWPHGIKLLNKISEDVEQQRFLWVLETALYCVIWVFFLSDLLNPFLFIPYDRTLRTYGKRPAQKFFKIQVSNISELSLSK